MEEDVLIWRDVTCFEVGLPVQVRAIVAPFLYRLHRKKVLASNNWV